MASLERNRRLGTRIVFTEGHFERTILVDPDPTGVFFWFHVSIDDYTV